MFIVHRYYNLLKACIGLESTRNKGKGVIIESARSWSWTFAAKSNCRRIFSMSWLMARHGRWIRRTGLYKTLRRYKPKVSRLCVVNVRRSAVSNCTVNALPGAQCAGNIAPVWAVKTAKETRKGYCWHSRWPIFENLVLLLGSNLTFRSKSVLARSPIARRNTVSATQQEFDVDPAANASTAITETN